MNYIQDIFSRDKFYISKIKYEHNSPSRDIIIRLNGHEYEVNYNNLRNILSSFDINLEAELSYYKYPVEKLDNRPFYKKSIDFQLGKKVDFKNPKRYIPVNLNFLRNELEKAYEEFE